MKNLFLSTLILTLSSLAIADPSRHTASYYKGLAPEYIGKKISLDVAAVHPLHKAQSEKFGFLVAQTFDTRNRSDGGKIFVVSDKEELLDLVKRFGVKPDVERARRGGTDVDTTRLTGILRQAENKMLYLDTAESEVPSDVLKELKKAMTAAAKPAAKGKGRPAPRKGKKGR